jgi:putative ABC transport system permease protein
MTLLRWLWEGQWRAQPGRAVTAVLAIAIGVALALAIHLVNRSALDEFGRALSVINGDAQLQIVATAGAFDEDLYASIAGDSRVVTASPIIDTEVPLASGAGATLRSIRIIGLDVFRAARVTPGLLPMPVDAEGAGSSSPLFGDDTIFLSAAAMQRLALKPGGELVVRNGLQPVRLRVAGEVPGVAPDQVLGVMDIGALQWRLGWLGKLTRIDLRLADGVGDAALGADWAPMLKKSATLALPDVSAQRMSNLSRAYRVNLDVLSLVALFTGAFIVYTTLSLAIVRQRQSLAMLRVLGASSRFIAAHVFGQGLILGVLGAACGIALGVAIAAIMIQAIGGDLGGGYFSGTSPALSLDPAGISVCAALGIVAGVAGAIVPALTLRDEAPAQSLRGAIAGRQGRNRRRLIGSSLLFVAGALLLAMPAIDGLPLPSYAAIAAWLFGGIAMVPVVAALAGRVAQYTPWLWRSPPLWLAVQRMALPSASGSGALAGVVASFALSSAMVIMVGSFRLSVDHWLQTVLPADLYARGGGSSVAGSMSPAFQQRLRAVDGVARIEFLRVRDLTLDPTRPIVVMVARPVDASNPQLRLPITGSILPAPPGTTALYVSEAMVDLYGFKPGTVVHLPIGDGSASFFVRAVWRDYARQFGALVVDQRDYQRISGDTTVSDVAIWRSPGVTEPALVAALQNAAPELAMLDVRSTRDIRELSLRIFDRSFAVTYVLEAIAILIGIAGVTATFAGEAIARAREFGMLRHLGMTGWQVARQLAGESLLLVSIGVIWGAAIGVAIAWVLVDRVNPQSFHWTMDLTVPFDALIASGLALILAGTLAAVWAGRQAMTAAPLRAVREDW